jgi:hypothetical protein
MLPAAEAARLRAKTGGDAMDELIPAAVNAQRQFEQLHIVDAIHPGVVTCPLKLPLRDVARMTAV